MSSNLLSISPKKNNGRILNNEKTFDFSPSYTLQHRIPEGLFKK